MILSDKKFVKCFICAKLTNKKHCKGSKCGWHICDICSTTTHNRVFDHKKKRSFLGAKV